MIILIRATLGMRGEVLWSQRVGRLSSGERVHWEIEESARTGARASNSRKGSQTIRDFEVTKARVNKVGHSISVIRGSNGDLDFNLS